MPSGFGWWADDNKDTQGCLSLEWQVSFFNGKESKASFINLANNCWLADWLTDWLGQLGHVTCCKHIKTSSSYLREEITRIQQWLQKQCKIRTYQYGATLFCVSCIVAQSFSLPLFQHRHFLVDECFVLRSMPFLQVGETISGLL